VKPSGVELIDRVLGGLPEGLPLVVTGPSGCGRTVLSLQLAAAAVKRNECAVMISAEPPPLLLRQAASLDLPLDEAVSDGRLVLLELDPRVATAVRIHGGDALVTAIREEISAPALLILESISLLTHEILDEALLRKLLNDLFAIATESEGIPVVTVETEQLDDSPLHRALKDLCGSLIRLERAPDGRRWLTVEKSRAGSPVAGAVIAEIGSGGFRGDGVPVDRRSGDRRSSDRRGGDRREAMAVQEKDRCKVLVVEDVAMERTRVADTLEKQYDVVFAENGFEAMTAILSERPDLILLDLVMPRISGWEVLRSLQASGSTIPILVISGQVSRAADRVRALILGASDVMMKPVNSVELQRKVETLLALPEQAHRPPEAGNAAQLLLAGEEQRILEEPGFAERLARARQFGQRYQIESSVLAIEASDPENHDRLIAAADQTLRTDDAIFSFGEKRALLFLLLAPPSAAEPVFRRLGDAFARLALPPSELRQTCVTADQAGNPEDWKVLFDDLHPWPAGAHP
jgi:DNA-binding response OmpR family regulator/KaiC/GvpD/RAD55 family RecA-like ATPase